MSEVSKSGKFQMKYMSLFERLESEAETKEERWLLFSKDRKVYDNFYCDFLKGYFGENNADTENLKEREQIDYEQEEKGITSTMMELIPAVKKIQDKEGFITAEEIIKEYGETFEKEEICKIFKADGLASVPQKVIAYLDRGEVSLDEEKYGEVVDHEPLILDKIINDYDEKHLEQSYQNDIREYLECEIAAMKSKATALGILSCVLDERCNKRFEIERGETIFKNPAGDPDKYHMMQKMLEPIWYKIFYKPYIETVIQAEPEDLEYLYGQYYNLLKQKDIISEQVLSNVMKESVQRLWLQEEKNKENYKAWKKRLETGLIRIIQSDDE